MVGEKNDFKPKQKKEKGRKEGKRGKRERKRRKKGKKKGEKEGNRKKKKEKRWVFGSQRKIFGEKIIFFPRGKEYHISKYCQRIKPA